MEMTAPAKINLYLNIVDKRDDGYHDIDTLFEKVSICDKLVVEKYGKATEIICDQPLVPTGRDSLMMRAVDAFNRFSGQEHAFRVILEKNIPVGAGLGGGSSDAAALLKAINILTGTPLSKSELIEIGAELGADIPFFLHNTSFAYGRNRGDAIEEVETDLELWHIVINPPFETSTKDMYGKWTRFGLTKDNRVDRIFSTFLREKNVQGIADNLHNDLQRIALEEFPDIRPVFSELEKYGSKGTLLSGSGPTVFGIFDRDQVISAKEKIEKIFPAGKGWKIFIASTHR